MLGAETTLVRLTTALIVKNDLESVDRNVEPDARGSVLTSYFQKRMRPSVYRQPVRASVSVMFGS